VTPRGRQPLVLAVDTSGARAGAALAGADGHVVEDYLPADDRHGEVMAELVSALLSARGHRPADLTGLAVVVGPGSYTGLRIGLALVRGLALVDAQPVVGIGTLELMALDAAVAPGNVLAVADAARDRYYVAELEREGHRAKPLAAPSLLSGATLAGRMTALASDSGAWTVCASAPSPSSPPIRDGEPPDRGIAVLAAEAGLDLVHVRSERAARLAAIALDRLAAGEGRPAEQVLPLYVGATGARPNRNKVVVGSAATKAATGAPAKLGAP
jgi:tRNA threonylcarbamoyl adenosine modification protein YeaZ